MVQSELPVLPLIGQLKDLKSSMTIEAYDTLLREIHLSQAREQTETLVSRQAYEREHGLIDVLRSRKDFLNEWLRTTMKTHSVHNQTDFGNYHKPWPQNLDASDESSYVGQL